MEMVTSIARVVRERSFKMKCSRICVGMLQRLGRFVRFRTCPQIVVTALAACAAVTIVVLFFARAPDAGHSRPPNPIDLDLFNGVDLDDAVAKNPGYLGPVACAPCHADRVAEFQLTNHFRTCRIPRPEEMPAQFTSPGTTFSTQVPELRFEMSHVNGTYWQTAIRSGPLKQERVSERIDLVHGAGTADDVYFSWYDDGQIRELPVGWLHPIKQWGTAGWCDAARFSSVGRDGYTRPVTVHCMECHNTWFEHVIGTENRYTRNNFIAGVTCERCHGPGRDHVEFHVNNPEVSSPHAIVHPGQMPRDRKIDLCAQCHSNSIRKRGPALSYRPGEPLEKHYRATVCNFPEDDHVANQVQYLLESKCYQRTDSLTCTTCHDPHVPMNESAVKSTHASCLKCHAPYDCGERRRLPDEIRNNCVGCHMPARDKVQVFFFTQDDDYWPPVKRWEHRIGVYPEARDEVLLKWHLARSDDDSRQEAARLRIKLVDFWRNQADELLQQHRFLAAIQACREVLRWDSSPEARAQCARVVGIKRGLDAQWVESDRLISERRFDEAIESLVDILSKKPDIARAHGRLGMLYAMSNRKKEAREHLQTVSKYDPNDCYGEAMLGWLAFLEGKFSDAVEHYTRASAIEPYDAKINYHWGLALGALDKCPEAIHRLRMVLTIDPNHVGAHVSLSHILRLQGRTNDALSLLLRATKVTESKDMEVLAILAETYASLGRLDDAAKTAVRAFESSRENGIEISPQLRMRFDAVSR